MSLATTTVKSQLEYASRAGKAKSEKYNPYVEEVKSHFPGMLPSVPAEKRVVPIFPVPEWAGRTGDAITVAAFKTGLKKALTETLTLPDALHCISVRGGAVARTVSVEIVQLTQEQMNTRMETVAKAHAARKAKAAAAA